MSFLQFFEIRLETPADIAPDILLNQFGSSGWHFGSSQCYRRWRTHRSVSSSLRLPGAKPIFDRQVKKVCPILTMRS
jgi:hypothetical protein